MKSRELDFLKYFVSLLDEKYDVENILKLCQSLNYTKESQTLSNYLNDGYNLQDALLKCHFSSTFKEYFCFFKNTFSISEAIKKTIFICEKKKNMKNRIIQKLTYPFCMLVFLFIFSIFVVIYLLPQVENLFIDFQIEKTLFINIVFTMFHVIPYFIFIVFSAIIITSVYVYRNVKNIHYKVIDQLIEKTYFISKIIKKYYSLKFAIYYDELLKNRYDATTIIEILYDKINDSDMKMIIYELYNFIVNGESLNDAIESFPYFEKNFKIFYFMMSQNSKEKSLNDYINIVFMQIDSFLSKFIKVVVPLIYGFVAAFVIVVYISIIIPMMNVITTL